MTNGNSSSKAGLILGALIVGGVVGYLIGVKSNPPPPQPSPTPTAAAPTATPVPQPAGLGTQSPLCPGQGSKYITVSIDGIPDCLDAEIYPALKDTVTWTAPQGTTLQIVFENKNDFKELYCGGNHCESRLASATAQHKTPQPYNVNLFLKGTPTPNATMPTPTPRNQAYGHIIIKP